MRYDEIPHSESRADAKFLEWSHAGGEPVDWELLQMAPWMIRVASQSVFRGWTKDELEAFASHSLSGRLFESIKEHGIQQPLVVFKGCLEGNHRLAAALALGHATVPVYCGRSVRHAEV